MNFEAIQEKLDLEEKNTEQQSQELFKTMLKEASENSKPLQVKPPRS